MTRAACQWLRRRLTVRLRLVALLLASGALLAWLGDRLLGGIDRLGVAVDKVATTELPCVEHVGAARAAFLRAYLCERSLLFQSMASDQAKAMVAEHGAASATVAAAWQQFAAKGQRLAAAIDFQAPWSEWTKVSKEVLTILADDTPAARRDAIDLSMGLSKELADAVDKVLESAARACSEEAARESAAAAKVVAEQRQGFYRALTTGLVALLVLGVLIVQSVVGPLRKAVRALRECADGAGDLSQRLPAASGEIGELAGSFNRFVAGLGTMVQAMRTTASEVHGAAKEIAGVGDAMAASSRTVEQRLGGAGTASQEVLQVTTSAATSTRELSASIHEIADNATRLTCTAQEVGKAAATAFATVEAMGRDSGHVQRIVGVIDGIARQTNLLALNASVEAARAGEYGAGFAVVAERVKSLSIESAKATAEIRERIEAFVTSVKQTITAIAGIKDATVELGDSTAGIASSVEQQSAVTQEFADSFATIQSASDRIATELGGIDAAARSASAGATAATGASGALVQASSRLAELVGNFRV